MGCHPAETLYVKTPEGLVMMNGGDPRGGLGPVEGDLAGGQALGELRGVHQPPGGGGQRVGELPAHVETARHPLPHVAAAVGGGKLVGIGHLKQHHLLRPRPGDGRLQLDEALLQLIRSHPLHGRERIGRV